MNQMNKRKYDLQHNKLYRFHINKVNMTIEARLCKKNHDDLSKNMEENF